MRRGVARAGGSDLRGDGAWRWRRWPFAGTAKLLGFRETFQGCVGAVSLGQAWLDSDLGCRTRVLSGGVDVDILAQFFF